MASLLLGCEPQAAAKHTIMLILDSEETYYSQMIDEGVTEAVSEYSDVTVLKRIPAKVNDSEQQNRYLQEAVNLGIDTVIFSAADIEQSQKDLARASEKGLSIIMIDSFLSDSQDQNYIGTNDQEAGELAGTALIEALGTKAKIGILNFEELANNSQEREKERAFHTYLENFPDIEIIEQQLSWSDSKTVQLLTEEMLSKYPEMDGIVAFNEITTIGAGRAVEAKELQDKVAVIGFDTQKECIELLETGSIAALIVQNPFAIGYLAVQRALNPNDEKRTAEPLFTEVELVTKKNMYQTDKEKLLFPFTY